MEQLIRILIKRLASRGMEITSIPPFIRNVGTSIAANPNMSLQELNTHLNSLGWDGFELDNSTFYLLMAVLDPEMTSKLSRSFDTISNGKGPNRLAEEKKYLQVS